MKWPRRHQRTAADTATLNEDKERLAVSEALLRGSQELRREHEEIMRRNGLAPKIHKALGGER